MTNSNRDAGLPAMTVVALLTALSLELVRSTGALLEVAFDVSVFAAAGTALSTYLGAAVLGLGLLWAARRADGPTVVLTGVILLAVARLVVQGLTATPRVAVGLLTISLSIAVLTIAVGVLAGRDRGGRAAAVAVAVGAAFSMGMQLILGTWDAFWRHDSLGWGITVLVLICLVGAAELARRDPATTPTCHVRRLWVLGPALCLLVMVMANSGFAASQSGVRLAIAGPAATFGLLLAGTAISLAGRPALGLTNLSSQATALGTALAPAAAIAGVFWASGPLVLVFLIAGQLSAFVVMAMTLDQHPTRGSPGPALVRDAATASLVGLGTILPLLVFQLDYDIPLGFPNELVIVATAVLFGAATLARGHVGSPAAHLVDDSRTQGRVSRPSLVLLTSAAAIALVGSALAIGRELTTDPQSDLATQTASLTLVSWNLHYGVDPYGEVDLEQIARSIEEHNPSIITLQEVSRGWVIAGGTDMATWLAQRLDMKVAYAPAADRQFGNVVLSNLPMTNITTINLPYGNGPQERSAISVDIALPTGTLRVTSAHLQSKDRIPNRLDQIEALLTAQTDTPPLIIAGDFNAQPGSAEIQEMTNAGLISAQDVSGDPSALTDPSINPVKRIDWVFGRGVFFINTEVLPDALSSDHLPLVVIFSPT
jgi:endonuclease/exonuclease/phosphatase family metal-dependent hydrolase